jgi:transposase
MEQYVGLDVSLKETSLCVVDQTGTTLWQGKCASTPESLARRAPAATRIGLESGLLSTWHWHALKALGLPVVCLDARHAKAALSLRLNKTDANDAEGLAQIVRTGWYRPVQVKSFDSHLILTLLAALAGLVAMHRDVANQIRGALKTFGLVLGKVAAGAFEARVRQLIAGNPLLVEVIEALLKVWRTTGEQLVTLHRRVLRLTQTDETCRRLMTVPGVGAVTAAAFMATVDDPERFRRSSSVGAYLGLTPRRCQSGEIDYTGRISKRGDGLMRSYLFEAANVLLTRVSMLKAWGMRLAKRSGATRAKVALARKLAVILHRLWRDGTSFRWSTQKVSG